MCLHRIMLGITLLWPRIDAGLLMDLYTYLRRSMSLAILVGLRLRDERIDRCVSLLVLQ